MTACFFKEQCPSTIQPTYGYPKRNLHMHGSLSMQQHILGVVVAVLLGQMSRERSLKVVPRQFHFQLTRNGNTPFETLGPG